MCISLRADCLPAGELADIGEPAPEQIGAAGQVPVEPFVDLVIGDRDGLVLPGLQVGRPGVQRSHVVRLQVLLAGDVEAGLGGVLLDHRGQRQPPAGIDLVHDEFDEPHRGHRQRQAFGLHFRVLGNDDRV